MSLILLLVIYLPMLLFPVAFLMPDCVCCGTCSLFDNDYELADWTQVSGTWSITSGVITCTSSNAVLIATGVTTDATGARMFFTATGADGDVWRVILGRADASNYTYVRIRFANTAFSVQAAYLSAYLVTAGVESALSFRNSLGFWQVDPDTGDPSLPFTISFSSAFMVCWDDCELFVRAPDGATATFIGNSHSGGLGFATGSNTPSSTQAIGGVSIEHTHANDVDCPVCQTCCEGCDGELPAEVEVTFPADALSAYTSQWSGETTTTDCCSLLNGQTFVLEDMAWDNLTCHDPGAGQANNVSACWYGYDLPSACTSTYTYPLHNGVTYEFTWSIKLRMEFRSEGNGATRVYLYIIFTLESGTRTDGLGGGLGPASDYFDGCVQQWCLTGAGTDPEADCLEETYSLVEVNCVTPLGGSFSPVCVTECRSETVVTIGARQYSETVPCWGGSNTMSESTLTATAETSA